LGFSSMLCFRVILWGGAALVALIPFCFLVGIIGRIAGFRPGSQAGTVEKVFGWFGIVVLTGLILGICLVAGVVDWGVTSAMMQNPQFANQFQPPPQAKPIPAHWNDKQMQLTYLADMQEFNVNVGWGNFGKKGKLGYRCGYGEDVQVDGKKWPNALSAHPPSFGVSRVSYRLQGNAKLFKTWCAFSDPDAGFRPESQATFHVFGDGVLLWSSAPVRLNKQIEECRISVEGVDTMELQVQCPGLHGSVRAVWLEPHVLR
jgi:NPCBM/NEW2 domain